MFTFSVNADDAVTFVDILKAVAAGTEFVTFEVSDEGMKFVSMEVSHVSFTLCTIGTAFFEVIEGQEEVSVHGETLLKVMKLIPKEYGYVFNFNDETSKLVIMGHNVCYHLATANVDGETLEVPADQVAMMLSVGVREDDRMIGLHKTLSAWSSLAASDATIKVHGTAMTVSTEGDSVAASHTYFLDTDVAVEKWKMKVGIRYLTMVPPFKTLRRRLRFNADNQDFPLLIEDMSDNVLLRHFIAPKIN